MTVGGLGTRRTSPRSHSRGPPVNARPGASPVIPATGDLEDRSLLDLGATAKSSSNRPAPAAQGPALVTTESFTDGDAPPRRGASSPGHRKSYTSIRSPDSDQRDSAAARNPAAHSTTRNAARSHPQFEPATLSTPPRSTTRRSCHRESVWREMREHA